MSPEFNGFIEVGDVIRFEGFTTEGTVRMQPHEVIAAPDLKSRGHQASIADFVGPAIEDSHGQS